MTNYNPFDVILIPFPFTDLKTQKQRPALVLARVSERRAKALYVCTMITSQVEGEKLKGDVLLQNWGQAGLIKPCKTRLAKVVTIEAKLIRKKLGTISSTDQCLLKKHFEEVFVAFL